MKNILVLGTTDNRGGAAQVGWELARHLPTSAYQVKFIVSQRYSRQNNVLGLDSANPRSFSTLFRHARTFISGSDIDWGHGADILAHPWYQAADIVHCHNLHGNFFRLNTLITLSRQKKLIWTLHDAWALLPDVAYGVRHSIFDYPPMLPYRQSYLATQKTRILSACSGTIVAPSQWLLQLVLAQPYLHNFRQVFIPNGVDLTLYSPRPKRALRRKYHLPLNRKLGIFVGNPLDPRKGWHYLSSILASNPQFSFLVVGGEGRGSSRLTYLGARPSTEVAELIAASDYLLAPSLEENASLTVMQALASGIPVIAFASGGIPEQLKHQQTGYLAHPQSSDDLLSGINWLVSRSPQQYSALARSCRQYALDHFDLNQMVKQYRALYQEPL